MQSIVSKIVNYLPTEQLNSYWDHFEQVAFAIYDSEKVYLFNHPNYKDQPYIELVKTSEFQACTCIIFEGVPTAIVDTRLCDSYETIYSVIVHESFHGFQYLLNESRLPNEISGFTYPIDFNNIQLRILERTNLYEAFIAEDLQMQAQYINEFIEIREKRRRLFPEYVEYENLIETVEGPAFYVEYQALKDVQKNKQNSLDQYVSMLLDSEASQLNIRRSCYSSGLFICLLLDKISESWKVEFMKSKLDVYSFFKEIYPNYYAVPIALPENAREVNEIIQNVISERKKSFDDFEKLPGVKLFVEGAIKITGFDPMNITLLNNKALHRTFLKVKIADEEYVIQGPVCTEFQQHFMQIESIQMYVTECPRQVGNQVSISNIGEVKGMLKLLDSNLYRVKV
ncbi:hypothetical protein MKZ17_00895 [Solibacillus sp. FSL R7-0682]|uniref:hypothetical protein n=1 Tax=Solibacillus sp. FSL R7-0682 TaxID=2921690 RepID=UPI0030FCCA64